MSRKQLGKKTRFEIFKRDHFKCAYCGQTPPAVVLEVDHVIPLAAGGTDDVINLVAACFDCNRGKGAIGLTSLPCTIESELERIRERRAQVLAFERLIRAERRQTETNINRIEDALLRGTGMVFTDSFRSSVRAFLGKLPLSIVLEAAEKSAGRWEAPVQRTKYFCGICWRTIKGDAPSANWAEHYRKTRNAGA